MITGFTPIRLSTSGLGRLVWVVRFTLAGFAWPVAIQTGPFAASPAHGINPILQEMSVMPSRWDWVKNLSMKIAWHQRRSAGCFRYGLSASLRSLRVVRNSMKCCHLEGRGGSKGAVRYIAAARTANSFVFRTDVKSYYASIDHEILIGILAEHVADASVLDLLRQYIRHTIYEGGLYEDVERGISLGCPLSPLMGALYLKRLDERIEATGMIYARFMDDWVTLAPTRWKLRAAVPVRSEIRGTGTVFPAKQRVNGLSDLADLYFVAGKMSQSPN